MAGRITVSASSVVGYQPRQQNEQQAIDVAQRRSVRRFAPEYIDLVAKNQDLRFTPCAGAQQPNERTTKRSEQLNHRPRASPDSRRFARYRVSDKDRRGRRLRMRIDQAKQCLEATLESGEPMNFLS